eukprot:scaffold1666_cov424-Prasinococcus_capsulatus_cf.AAC.2
MIFPPRKRFRRAPDSGGRRHAWLGATSTPYDNATSVRLASLLSRLYIPEYDGSVLLAPTWARIRGERLATATAKMQQLHRTLSIAYKMYPYCKRSPTKQCQLSKQIGMDAKLIQGFSNDVD